MFTDFLIFIDVIATKVTLFLFNIFPKYLLILHSCYLIFKGLIKYKIIKIIYLVFILIF